MSLRNTIRYNQAKEILARIDELRKIGVEFVQKIAKSLQSLYPTRFEVVENAETKLKLAFFGLSLVIRLEIEIEDEQPGRVRIYLSDESAPQKLQKLDLEYVFDDLGNVNESMTITEAAPSFGADIIEQLQKQKKVLLP